MFYYDVNYSHLLNAYANKATLASKMEGLRQFCHFPPHQKTEITYVCFQNEVCCANGCCVSSFRRMMQFWYFWLLFVLVCVAFTGCMHYCTKIRETRLERRFQRHRRGFSHRLFRTNRMFYRRPNDNDPDYLQSELGNEDPRVNQDPRRNLFARRLSGQRVVEPFDREAILGELWETYRSNENDLQNCKPPDYNEIEKDPLYLEPPPRYADACKIVETHQRQNFEGEIASLPSYQEPQSSNHQMPEASDLRPRNNLPPESSNQLNNVRTEIVSVHSPNDSPVQSSNRHPQ